MTTTVAAPPLAVVSKHDGYTALRLLLNDGAHVVLSNLSGGVVCIYSKCRGERDEVCEHAALAKALTNDEIAAIPHSFLSRVRDDA